ncbi:MAG TPA: HAMP domain-containing sensor histidine kinase [Gemmatimonadales bacterium]|nr:HAMP domain-containing sensor histidine kinase [Gemmatimonadales bacterium]
MALLVAINRAAVFGVAARWVLHDLRSPAQSLTLMADLVADPSADLEGTLREACGHLARSLDLLSRVLHPPAPVDVGPISIREPIAFVADLQRAGRSSARLEVTVDPAIPAATGVQRHVEHALLALVLDTMDALRDRETATIRISAGHERDRAEIVVAGAAEVAPEEQARLFEIPPGFDPAQQPLGVSLPVAREVIRLCGGTLTYASRLEGGSGYVVSLPLWQQG